MNKGIWIKRVICLSLAALMVFSGSGIAYGAKGSADEGSGEVVSLKTVEDLLKLSGNSITDTYSRGKVFRLENDIDISGVDFPPVSIFSGIFEGNGKSITGFEMTQSGADMGFFRFVEEGAVIRNLTISGEINPDGIMEHIGGIAGTNSGRIEKCVFEGSMLTKQISGGIAGINKESGVIEGCTNKGDIIGIKQIGGIVGKNEGIVTGCSNIGSINATSETVHDLLDEDPSMTLSLANGENRNYLADENKIIYIGGIAGSSSGAVTSCINRGAVGYRHMGYKVGGIVGYQQGQITSCHNYGTITGRRDVGGVAGQLEPYVEVIYLEDSADKLRTQGDNMEAIMDDFSDVTKRASDTTEDDLDSVGSALEDITDALEGYKDYYKDKGENFHDEMESRLDAIEDTLDDMEMSTKASDFSSPIKAIRGDVDKIKAQLGQMAQLPQGPSLGASGSGSWEDVSDQLDSYTNQLEASANGVKDSAQDIDKQIDRMLNAMENLGSDIEDVGDNLDTLERQLKRLKDYVRSSTTNLRNDLDGTDTDLSEKNDTLSDQLDALKDDMKASKNEISDQLDIIRDQMRLMGDITADGLDALSDKLDFDPEEDDWYIDISDMSEVGSENGTLTRCTNEGEIISDINGGGIAGSMAVEPDVESDFSIEKIGERSMKYDYYLRATVFDCENSGNVTVKNNYAGGIIGRSDVGAVIRCNNYGPVESTDGDYAGGIAGKSGYLVRNCYVLSDVSGNSYVGGISGFGKDASANCAMVGIYSESGEKNGSIMGDVDDDAVVFSNYYVNEGLAAINNLTYEQAARGIDYEGLLEMEETPGNFRSFTVRFVSDGNLVKKMNCYYGQTIKDEEIPVVPDHDGKNGVWESKNLSFVNRNIVVNAVYNNWTTTIESGEERSVMLAEGLFYEDTTLQCTSVDPQDIPQVKGYAPVCAYNVEISSQYGIPEEAITIRLLAENTKSNKVLMWSSTEQSVVEAQRDGSYLVLSASAPGNYAVLKKSGPSLWLIFLIIGVVLLLATILFWRKWRKKGFRPSKGKERHLATSGSGKQTK